MNLNWDIFNYISSLVLTGIMTLALGVFVLFKNRTSKLNQLFFAYSLSISLWAFSQSVTHTNYTLTWIGARIEHFAVSLISVFFLHFVTVLTNRPSKKLLVCIYILGGFFSILGVSSKTIVKTFVPMRISPTAIMLYSVVPGKFYHYYVMFFIAVVAYGTYLLYKEYRLSTGAKRNQLKYMLVGSIVGYIGGGLNFCYVFKIYVYPLLPFITYAVPIYVFIAAYAIVKHRLMDIKVVLGRTGLLVLTYGFIIYVCLQVVAILKPYLEETLGKQWVYFPLVMYTILISLAPFFYLYLQKKMEDKIFKKQHQYQKTLKQLSFGMTKIKNINKLLDLTVIQIVRAVRLTHASIFLYDKTTNKYILKASRGKFKKTLGIAIEPDNAIVGCLLNTKSPLVYYDIEKTNKEELKFLLAQLSTAVCIPGFIEDKLVGFLMLGEKLSGEIYTQEDIDTFVTLTNQASLAIDNALGYEELMNTKDQLIKQERLATLGEFASEVAHEIKNPLQVIKTFTELINERYNDKAFRVKFSKLASLEIDRIDNFVRQLIRFSHPLPPKFSAVDITEAIDSVLELMESDFVNKNILVKKQYQTQQVKITADVNQLKQVLLNLMTNAIEAMQNSTKRILTISTSSFDSHIIIKITDTGCGISPENIPQLFNPLFTTKEKGSGLGLSIVYTIIRTHNSKIDVESKVGEGTTFTITI